MAIGESNIVAECLILGSKLGCVLGKNVRGMFMTLGRNPRKMKAGWLIPASPDLLGYHSLVITPEMVGKRIAVAMYIEAKTPDGFVAKEQQHFIDRAVKDGAIAGIVRSGKQMEIIFTNYIDALKKPML